MILTQTGSFELWAGILKGKRLKGVQNINWSNNSHSDQDRWMLKKGGIFQPKFKISVVKPLYHRSRGIKRFAYKEIFPAHMFIDEAYNASSNVAVFHVLGYQRLEDMLLFIQTFWGKLKPRSKGNLLIFLSSWKFQHPRSTWGIKYPSQPFHPN